MNTMISAILFSMMAFATADITIKNNCNVEFEIHDIYGPSGTGILCYPMTKLAVGNQITLNNFDPHQDVILTRASANLTSKSFNYIGTLENIRRNEEDIDGVCKKILKGGEIQVYKVVYKVKPKQNTVKSEVYYLSLCAINPKKNTVKSEVYYLSLRAIKPKKNTIINRCSDTFEFAQVMVNPIVTSYAFQISASTEMNNYHTPPSAHRVM